MNLAEREKNEAVIADLKAVNGILEINDVGNIEDLQERTARLAHRLPRSVERRLALLYQGLSNLWLRFPSECCVQSLNRCHRLGQTFHKSSKSYVKH
jgi:hypothetical protein